MAAVLVAILAPVGDAAAQTAVRGTVLDATSGAPVAGAAVTVVELQYRALTDSAGAFSVSVPDGGTYTVAVQRIGYRPVRQERQLDVGDLVVVRLEPRAIELEGLTVSVRERLDEQFQAREAAVASKSFASGRAALEASDAYSVVEFFQEAHRIQLQPCPGYVMGSAGCVLYQGRRTGLEVWVDDMPFDAGVSIMYSFTPEELYRVEYFPNLNQLHLITVEYAEWMADRGRRPRAICIVCD